MNEQTSSIEEQEELLDRLTWSDDDTVMGVTDRDPMLTSTQFTLTIKRDGRVFAASGEQLAGNLLRNAAYVVKFISPDSDELYKIKVLMPFLSKDGVLFKPTSK